MSSYKIVVPENSRTTHVSNHSKNGKPVVQKDYQSKISGERNRQITHVMTPSPNDKSLSTGSQIKFFIEANTCRIIKRAKLRFLIGLALVAGDISNYQPVGYWFDRIEFYIRDTGVEIGRIYSDVIHMLVNQVEKIEETRLNYHYNQSDCYGTKTNPSSKRHGSPTDQYFYLPLHSFFDNMDLDLSTINTDIEIRMHPRVQTLNAGDTLKEVAIVIDEVYPDPVSNRAHLSFLNNNIVSHTYLDTQHYVEQKSMVGSTKYTFDLDMFDKKSAGLLVCIKPQNSTSSECINLGQGTFVITDVNGASLLGGGRAIVYDHYQDNNIPWQNDYFKKTNQLLIPFTHPIKAINGVMHGYHQFDQSKMKLEITTPAAQAAATSIAYNVRAVFDASVIGFGFRYKNKTSIVLGFNANAAQIQANWNSLMNEFGYNCTAVANDFTAATAIGFTVTTLAGQNVVAEEIGELPEMYIQTNNAAPWQPYRQLLNASVSGAQWFTGSTACDVHIYSLHHKIVEQDRGMLQVFDGV